LQRVAGHQLVRVDPAGKRFYALEPGADRRILAPAHAPLVGPVQVAAGRDVDDGRGVADDELAVLEVQLEDAERAVHAPAQEFRDRRLTGLLELQQEAQRADIARELVVVPEQPAQDLPPLRLALPAELAESRGEVIEDHAG